MNRIIVIALLLVAFAVPASAQWINLRTGVTHNIADAYLSAADSLHVMGEFSLMKADGMTRLDSVAILTSANDSLNGRVLLVPVFLNYPTYTTVADTTACYMQATGIKNYVALNQGSEPKAYAATYFDIKKALEGKWGTGIMAVVQKVRVYFRLHPTGSEVASSGKTFNMSVIQY